MKRKAKLSAGGLLIAIGTFHNVVGAAITSRLVSDPAMEALAPGRNPLLELVTEGVGGSGAPDAVRFAFFWFFFFGFVLMLLGGAVLALERAEISPPRSFLAGLLAFTLVGVLAMPASGFWLVFAPLLVLAARRRHVAN